MNQYLIGEASKLVDLPSKTIRFYEEEGLISPAERAENGYRLYSQKVINELRILKYTRDLGLPLSEVKKLMKGCQNNGCHHQKEYLISSIEKYLLLIDQRIEESNQLKIRLNSLQETLLNHKQNNKSGPYCCDIFHQLINTEIKKGGGEHEKSR